MVIYLNVTLQAASSFIIGHFLFNNFFLCFMVSEQLGNICVIFSWHYADDMQRAVGWTHGETAQITF
jgi:hypothetical protein